MFIDTELKSFGESIGIKDLHLNNRGCVKFSFERDRTLFIERGNEKIFFFIIKEFSLAPLPFHLYEKALKDCQNQQSYPFLIQAVAKSDHDVGFLTSLYDNECYQPTLNKVFEFLLQKVDQLN